MQKIRDDAVATGTPRDGFHPGRDQRIEMPNLDGLTLCRYLKEDPILRQLPVAMFSSLITPAMSRKCESVHADVQFAKP